MKKLHTITVFVLIFCVLVFVLTLLDFAALHDIKQDYVSKEILDYLNDGFFQGTQVVPSEWVKLSTIERTGMIGTYYSGWNKTYGYGYLWWVRRLDDKIDAPFAMGHGGQRIAILSNANAVMVTQAEPNPKPPSSSYKRHKAIDSLLFEDFAYFLLKPLPDITRVGALTRSALLRGLYIENRAYIPNKGNALRLMDDL